MRLRAVASFAIAALGALGLLAISLAVSPAGSGQVVNFFVYQGITLALSLSVIALIRLVLGRKFQYLRLGTLQASATPNRFLGITTKDNWSRVGATFLVVITLATLGFMLLQWFSEPAKSSPPVSSWILALLIALPLSALNAFNEEIITRWVIVEGFDDGFRRFAPWASALVFGSVHYFGTPGGFVGVVMAGFLGWFLAQSIQQTRGIGWAWLVHFAQDVVILTFVLVAII
jgi:membrane protease YdiL (CAAX protease family)